MRSEDTTAAAMSESVPPNAETETDAENWISGGKKLEDEYLLGDVIGRGHSSVVYRCLRKGRTEWACKVLKKRQLNKKAVLAHLKSIRKLKHPNIIHLREVFETEDEIQLILELAQGGELFERIVERGHYSEEDAAQVVRSILKALQYLHSHGIIHRGLKPENLLYLTDIDESELKVADHGFGLLLSEDQSPANRSCGSLGYSAPEILLNKGFDSSTDMWSLGVIAYIMLCGYEPFWDDRGEAVMAKKIIEGDYSFPSPLWDEISDSAKELISQLLSVEPNSRPSAEKALNHPWTQGISTPKLHMDQTILRLREFNAKRRFRVATKAVLATCRALSLLTPAKKTLSQGNQTEFHCFSEEPMEGGRESSECDKVKMCCACSLIDGSETSEESLPSLPTDGKDIEKTSTKLATKFTSQYKENYVGLG